MSKWQNVKKGWKEYGKKVEFLDSGPGRIAVIVIAALMLLYGLYPVITGGDSAPQQNAPSYMLDE